MSARSLSPTEMAFRRPGHPLDCLRIIVLPECVVCGNPTKYYCGGCRAGPAFCSSEHYMEYWPVHSRHCQRDIALYSARHVDVHDAPTHPYRSTVVVATQSAIDCRMLSPGTYLPSATKYENPQDRVVRAMYAKYDKLLCYYLDVNLSPHSLPEGHPPRIFDCFESTTSVDSIIVRRDITLTTIDTPYHIFYCAESYAGRQDPNQSLLRLTASVDVHPRRIWYGTVLALKFATRACEDYVDMTVADVRHIRDFIAHFG